MKPLLRILIVAGVFSLIAPTSRGDSEIVLAIRYLQAQGTSHSHLYLYREDGKLLRQLTSDNAGQDSGLIFAPEESASPIPTASSEESASPAETSPPSYKSPDGSVELILREDPKDEDDQIDGPGHGKHYLLHDLKTGTETEFEKLPGFYGVFGLLHETQDKDQHFLFDGPLRLAFFDLHLNSTDGDTVFALDLTGPRLARLSPNWAAPIPLPGEAAFLTFTENRYVPIPGSKKTANCSYMERWDEKLNKIRYAREKSAALCYGASMYRAGLTPSTITLRRSSN
jgi:hypothetical protein